MRCVISAFVSLARISIAILCQLTGPPGRSQNFGSFRGGVPAAGRISETSAAQDFLVDVATESQHGEGKSHLAISLSVAAFVNTHAFRNLLNKKLRGAVRLRVRRMLEL